MKFSIIIPLYNKAKYIEKAIKSILSQTCSEYEIIVIDDGSTDNGFEVAELALIGVDETVLIKQKNSGVSTARNYGVSLAKYEYIAFLDADDWWEPTFLEEMKLLIKKYSDAALWSSSYFLVKNNIQKVAPICYDENFREGYLNYFKTYARKLTMPLWTGAVVVKKEVFEHLNGFNPKLKLGEDFDLWVRIALIYKIAATTKPLSNYNQDVELKWRAVGKLHEPKNHMLFNLDEIATSENKQLFDNLRVYSLLQYYLSDNYKDIAIKELNKVDWNKQPATKYRLYYKTPRLYLKLKLYLLNKLSYIKQLIIKRYN